MYVLILQKKIYVLRLTLQLLVSEKNWYLTVPAVRPISPVVYGFITYVLCSDHPDYIQFRWIAFFHRLFVSGSDQLPTLLPLGSRCPMWVHYLRAQMITPSNTDWGDPDLCVVESVIICSNVMRGLVTLTSHPWLRYIAMNGFDTNKFDVCLTLVNTSSY